MEKPRILVIDDESGNLDAIQRTLREHCEIVGTTSVQEALTHAKDQSFAVIVSDQRMPEMSGSELLSKVAQISPHTTRIMLTAFTDTKDMLAAINRAEIYRYVVKPWDNEELLSHVLQAAEVHHLKVENENLIKNLEEKKKALEDLNQNLEHQVEERTRDLKEANIRLTELAVTDPLTKLFNRRVFDSKITEEIERSRRYQHPMSVAMIDIDHFKHFNDMEGHPIGDEALKKCAHTIKGKIRRTDVFSRYGGEEFCLMMPETDIEGGRTICERLRSTVEQTVFQGKKGRAYLTVSIGLSAFPEHGENMKELVEAADEALYQAKNGGRNRTVVKSEDESFFMP